VEVRGRTAEDVDEALRLLDAVHGERRLQVEDFRARLLSAMVTAGVEVAPQPGLAQAERLAALRARLVAEGVHTHASLAQLRRSTSESGVRTWVARRRDEHALVVVKHDGRSLVPSFQLDEAGDPRGELRPLVEVLAGAGISGWQAWTWMRSRSGLLSGDVPEEVAATDPDRALRAARRHVAQLAA